MSSLMSAFGWGATLLSIAAGNAPPPIARSARRPGDGEGADDRA